MKIIERKVTTDFEQIMDKNGWDLVIYKSACGYFAEAEGHLSCIFDSPLIAASKLYNT